MARSVPLIMSKTKLVSQLRGHEITCIVACAFDDLSEYRGPWEWRYSDGVLIENDPDRPCGHCGLASTSEGYDGCIGKVAGALNACCGHGNPKHAYIHYADGTVIRHHDALTALACGSQDSVENN